MIRWHHSFLGGVATGLLLAGHVWILALASLMFGLALGRFWWLVLRAGSLLWRRFEAAL